MLKAISRAEKTVYLEMYIFEQDTEEHDFVGVLKQKASDGVRVVVLLDVYGSSSLESNVVDDLRSAGVEVLFYRYWLHRTHRKLLIVDSRVGFVGGVNIAHRFSDWTDLVVRIRGKRVLHSMTRSFARAYIECGGTDPILANTKRRSPLRKTRNWFVEHGLGGKRYTLRKHYEEQIDNATTTITLVTPYFLPHRWLLTALGRAVQRGVRVSILIPAKTDFFSVTRLNHYYAALAANLGMEVLIQPKMNHAKTMIVDERVAVVGSNNLDGLSFERNVEAGYFFSTPSMVRELVQIVDGWKKGTEAHESFSERHHWYDHVLSFILRPLARIL